MPLADILASPLRLPVIASPVFICSGPALVTAQCQSGIIGSFFALNARPSSALSDWLDEVAAESGSSGFRVH